MSKYIYNTTGSDITILGKSFPTLDYREVPLDMEWMFANSSDVLSLIASADIIISKTDSSDGHIINISDAVDHLKNNSPVKTEVQTIPAFGSKTFIYSGELKKLFARNCGIQQALSVGANTISYSMPYPWAKIIGVEVINSEALDYVDLKVKDDASGTYTTVPNYVLNQFAYAHNIPKDYYLRMAQFDADLYVGMVIEVTYNSVSAKTVGINFILNEVKT